MKRVTLFLLMFFVLTTPAYAYEISFLSSEEFLTQDSGRWLWQTYAESDKMYVDFDILHGGKRYLSGRKLESLPSGRDQVFYAVKAFVVPYPAEVLISLKNSIAGDLDKVKFRITKNETVVFPKGEEWCMADRLNLTGDIIINAKNDDIIRFVTAPLSGKPTENINVSWNPNIKLRSNNRFVQNAKINETGISFELVNLEDSTESFYLIAALYDGNLLKDVIYINETEAKANELVEMEIPNMCRNFTVAKILVIENMTDFRPYDKDVMLENK